MSKTDYAYLAGLFDGEGHITLTKSKPAEGALRKYVGKTHTTFRPARVASWQFCLNIGITNTDKRLINWLEEKFGGTHYTDKRHQQNWKSAYRWRLLGRSHQERVLLAILPYMVIKREQASLALDFIRMGDREDQKARLFFWERFMKLNGRGESPTTNTPDTEIVKIESGLYGDIESVPVVIQ